MGDLLFFLFFLREEKEKILSLRKRNFRQKISFTTVYEVNGSILKDLDSLKISKNRAKCFKVLCVKGLMAFRGRRLLIKRFRHVNKKV